MTRASGVGSWPGTDARQAITTVRDLLGEQIPYLPELPARGAGAEIIGRGALMLTDLAVETHPQGWRFADHPGWDSRRGRGWLGEDLDLLAELYDGWTGPLKLQVCGPWTLAAGIELPRGERALADHGARRDIAAALADGVLAHVTRVEALVPGAEVIVQIDEPALPGVLAAQIPTRAGRGTLRAVDRAEVGAGLREVIQALHDRDGVVHSCAPKVPVDVVLGAGAAGVSLDLTLAGGDVWETLGEAIEGGTQLWAGALPTSRAPSWRQAAEAVREPWRRLGLAGEALTQVTVTPACGLAGVSPSEAVAFTRATVDAAAALTDEDR